MDGLVSANTTAGRESYPGFQGRNLADRLLQPLSLDKVGVAQTIGTREVVRFYHMWNGVLRSLMMAQA